MTKRKVILFQNSIMDYRVATYNLINQVFDLTVAYNVADKTQNFCNFKKVKVSTRKVGPFYVWGKQFWQMARNADAVITNTDPHNLEIAIIPFLPHKYKFITWSIGLRASYTRPYDVNRKHTALDKFMQCILNASDANIFYMEKAKEFWRNTSLDFSKIFVAPNTTQVAPVEPVEKRNSILFVGSLYKGKGVDKLIEAFGRVSSKLASPNTLDIVGGGDQLEQLRLKAKELGLSDKVIFHGSIYNEEALAALFANAVLCISPTQAGLSVPKSLGYGVPFVTRKDAITGGELYHITSGVNGIIYNDDSELPLIIKDAIVTPEKFDEMGKNAKEYYMNFARPENQAQGFINALNFAFAKA